MATQDEVEQDQYRKIAELTAEVKTNNGRVEQLSASVDMTNRLIIKQLEQSSSDHKASMVEMRAMYDSHVKMTRYIFAVLSLIILFLIAALVYGAIGKDGLYAVRQTVPTHRVAGKDAIPISDKEKPRLPHNDNTTE